MGILYKHGCCVENAKLGVQLLNVQWSGNNLYPAEFSKIEQVNMVVIKAKLCPMKLYIYYGIGDMGI